MTALREAFDEFCQQGKGRMSTTGYGVTGKPEMDSTRFLKMCKACKMLSPMFTQSEAELVFVKVQPKERRKYITYKTFVEKLIPALAKEKECSAKDIREMVKNGCEASSEGLLSLSCNSSMYSTIASSDVSLDESIGNLSRASSHAQKWDRLSSGMSFSKRRSVQQPQPITRMFSTGRLSSSLKLSSSMRKSVSPEPSRRSLSNVFKFVEEDAPQSTRRSVSPAPGYTVLHGFDVEDTILTDEMEMTVKQQEAAMAKEREEYRRMWKEKREAIQKGIQQARKEPPVFQAEDDVPIEYVESEDEDVPQFM